LARCRLVTGDRAGVLGAFEGVPLSSSSHDDAQVARIERLVTPGNGHGPRLDELRAAATTLQSLKLDPARRAGLTVEVLSAALALVQNGHGPVAGGEMLLGVELAERDLRTGIERGYRALGHLAEDADERVRLVDRANDVRPRTWT